MDLAVAAQERRHRLTSDEIATVQPIVDFFTQGAKAAAPAKADVAGPPKPSSEAEADIDVDDDVPGAMTAKPAPEPKVVVAKRPG
jgi:hypothetical protein